MGGESFDQVTREGSSGEVEAGRQVILFGFGGEGGGGEEDGEVDGALGEGGADNESEEGELGETKSVGGGGGFHGGGGGGGGGGRGGGRGCEAEEGNVLRVLDGGGEIINEVTDRCACGAGGARGAAGCVVVSTCALCEDELFGGLLLFGPDHLDDAAIRAYANVTTVVRIAASASDGAMAGGSGAAASSREGKSVGGAAAAAAAGASG